MSDGSKMLKIIYTGTGARTDTRNYKASLERDRQERKKNKKRVRLFVGEKVRSFAMPDGVDVRMEIAQGGEVISIHDWRCRRTI